MVGAGSSIAEALKPVVLEQKGLKVGVVAATSVFRVGTQARKSLPDIAPLCARDYYAPRHPGDYGAGVPPAIVSILDERDWSGLVASIEAVRGKVDLLIASMHWGDYSRPWVLTDHEKSCAKKLIDAGVDVIFGHHHHFMRGMEFIKGKPVFYGLGHLAFDHSRFTDELRTLGMNIDQMSERDLVAIFGEYGI